MNWYNMKNKKEILEREIRYYSKIYPNSPKLVKYKKALRNLKMIIKNS